jgi:NAD(P)-dependent dehydrogenase (short-subunit alcohol dehydrogenase family)
MVTSSSGDGMLISTGKLARDSLENEVVIVTGAGRGIGYEAARALLWLGANVVVAEIDEKNGRVAADNLQKEFGAGKAIFVKTDVGSEKDVKKLANEAHKTFEKVDSVLNNATVFPMGAITDKPIEDWDRSYYVNLRGPVLLAKEFIPDMLNRKHGAFVSVSSSGAAPYMGAYEVLKTAQVELANTLATEVEGTGVYAFTIGPGIVRTQAFVEGGGQVASLMGKTLEELMEMNKTFEISPEAAGVGFAASIVFASRYHGQETSSIQVLRQIGIVLTTEEKEKPVSATNLGTNTNRLYQAVMKAYVEQSEGWKKRNLFERQWISRDFKKNVGMSIDEMMTVLKVLGEDLKNQTASSASVEDLKKLSAFYEHQQEQVKGFEKDPRKLEENSKVIDGWILDIKNLIAAFTH